MCSILFHYFTFPFTQAFFVCVIMWNTARLDKVNSTPCDMAASDSIDDSKPVPQAVAFHSIQDKFPITDCDMDSCINYFICNNKKEYFIYFYSEKDSRQSEKSHILSDIWKNDQHLDDLREKTYFTEDPTKACFFVILFDLTDLQEITSQNSHDVEAAIYALPHWNNTGTNNVILFLTDNQQNQDFLWDINTKKAIVAQTAFKKRQFRVGFDILIPPVVPLKLKQKRNSPQKNLWKDFPRLTPAFRGNMIAMLSYVDTASSDTANVETLEGEFTSEFKLHFQLQRDLQRIKTSPRISKTKKKVGRATRVAFSYSNC